MKSEKQTNLVLRVYKTMQVIGFPVETQKTKRKKIDPKYFLVYLMGEA